MSVLRRQSYCPHFIGRGTKSWSHTEVRPGFSQHIVAVQGSLPCSFHPSVRQTGHVEESEGQPAGAHGGYLFNPLSGPVDLLLFIVFIFH